MSVGILVVTHDLIGQQIVKTACETLGSCPLHIEHLAIPAQNRDLETLRERARALATKLDKGDGVLIITDLYGATPSNIAAELLAETNALLLSGLNLPMLIRLMNYPQLPLRELAEKGLSGAHDGTIVSSPE